MKTPNMDYGQPTMVWQISEQEKTDILAQRRKQEKALNLIVFIMGVGVLFFIMLVFIMGVGVLFFIMYAKTQMGA